MCNEDTDSAKQTLQKFLNEMGFADHPEMAHTAQRFTKLLRDFSNFDAPPISVFDVKTSGAVTLRNIPFYSLCAHHLMPFFGTAVIEYTPNHCVAGLSSITNTVQHLARKPTLQEALAEEIASHLTDALKPKNLTVTLTARQMCLELCTPTPGTEVIVTAQRGALPSTNKTS